MVVIMIVEDIETQFRAAPETRLDNETLVRLWSTSRGGMKCEAFGNKQASWARSIDCWPKGLNDDDIAVTLNLPREKVHACIAWILHFLKVKNRQELVVYSSTAA